MTKKADEHEVLLGHDELSEDESEGELESSDPDPEELEDNVDANVDLDDLVYEGDDDE